jgi:hypothetical protein
MLLEVWTLLNQLLLLQARMLLQKQAPSKHYTAVAKLPSL